MTDDTKRALEAIEPICRQLHIDASADDDFLYLSGQAIGIACNSTFATLMEFIGYVMAKVYCKDKEQSLPPALESRIKRYWFSQSQLEMLKKKREHYYE